MIRLVAVGTLAVYWALFALHTQFVHATPEPIDRLSEGVTPIVLGVVLAIGVGGYVGRWWVVLVAVAPLVPLAAVDLGGHRAPFHDARAPLSGWFWWLAFVAVPLAFGVVVRRSAESPGNAPTPS